MFCKAGVRAKKHAAKTNAFIAEMKAMQSGNGACCASSSDVSGSVTSNINGKRQHPERTVAENRGRVPKRDVHGSLLQHRREG